ncbi:UNVERIFIED_CONTAM: ATP-binding cassette domain-containing protein [Microbacterium sp. SLM126]
MRLTASNVGFSYPGSRERLFTGVEGSWHAGTMCALMGPSGSGKSTLLDLLGGLRQTDEGAVTCYDGDQRVVAPALHRQACTWVLQSNIVLAQRTVIDNVMISALVAGETPAKARHEAHETLARFGLGGREERVVNSLSGGEQQRVTIARCLLSPAEIVLADEPTGNLDARNTSLVIDCLRIAANAGKIVIVATHDHAVVAACDGAMDLSEAR